MTTSTKNLAIAAGVVVLATVVAVVTYRSSSNPSEARGHRAATAGEAEAPEVEASGPARQAAPPQRKGRTVTESNSISMSELDTFADPADAPPTGSGVVPADPRPLTTAEKRLQADNEKYVLEVLKPRAVPCLRGLAAAGVVEFKYTTFVTDNVAVPVSKYEGVESVTVYESDLPPEVTAAALECMLDAVDGTSFELHLASGASSGGFTFYQSWQVGPRPAETP